MSGEVPTHDLGAPPRPLEQARTAAKSGRPELATAWALISIAEDVTEIRRDLHWSIRRGGRSGG